MRAKQIQKSRELQRGSAMVEFVLCFALIWLPLFMGTLVLGFNLIRELQVTQLCRDGGHMYAYQTDFSQSSSQMLLANLAPILNMKVDGTVGQTVTIFSTIVYVDKPLCATGSKNQTCSNLNKWVFTRQIVVGKSAVTHASGFGTPPVNAVGGDVAPTDYLTNSAAVATGFSSLFPLIQSSSQPAYVAETWADLPSFGGWGPLSNGQVTVRFIF